MMERPNKLPAPQTATWEGQLYTCMLLDSGTYRHGPTRHSPSTDKAPQHVAIEIITRQSGAEHRLSIDCTRGEQEVLFLSRREWGHRFPWMNPQYGGSGTNIVNINTHDVITDCIKATERQGYIPARE